MSFITTLKDNLNDERNRRGSRDSCVVNSRALRELIHHFERLDSIDRANYDDDIKHLQHRFTDTLIALYENMSADSLMLFVMDTLRPIIKYRLKSKSIDNMFKY